MPLYEYLCDVCGRRFEAIQKFSDPPLEHCSECGGTVRKQVAAPAFQFKGTGWYITDYAKKEQVKTDGKADGASKEKSGDAAQAGKPADQPAEKSGPSGTPAGSSSGASASKGASES
jgi:putative FmdB family regulatory protein